MRYEIFVSPEAIVYKHIISGQWSGGGGHGVAWCTRYQVRCTKNRRAEGGFFDGDFRPIMSIKTSRNQVAL